MTTSISVRDRAAVGARRSPAQWRDLVEAFSRDGGTRKDFCARHGVALSTFDWWQRRLREEAMAASPADRGSSGSLFVELSAPVQPAPIAATAPPWDVELELGAGVVLRVRRAPC